MKSPPLRVLRWPPTVDADVRGHSREWLVTNGRGGYASGSVDGVPTRRFHGLLVASLDAPLGRSMMLNHLFETVRLPDGRVETPRLLELRLEVGLPVWRYGAGDHVFEKRLCVVHMQNTVRLTYRLVEGEGRLRMKLRPALHFRPHEGIVSGVNPSDYVLHARPNDSRYEIEGPKPYPPLRLRVGGARAALTIDGETIGDLVYRVEEERGYDARGALFSPGVFRADLAKGANVTLVASTEPWEVVMALSPDEAYHAELVRRERILADARVSEPDDETWAPELVLAADQFLASPTSRIVDAARAHASGDEVRTVIAGYHWFTDWGRDTMISLEGLTLVTGRTGEAGCILRTFGQYVRDGLIPNLFPEGKTAGLYHTADATLWFFHAIDRYLAYTKDRTTLELLLPVLQDIYTKHMQGTRFGIRVDPADGLLTQGEEGYQLTWMDAKVDDWVVTPRRGKAVEINALFYNALCLLARWLREEDSEAAARPVAEAAAQARASFNARFWCAERGHLYDVVDGHDGATPADDPALRPNQIFAISLPNPVLDRDKWRPVLDVVERELVTPVGLRSLARSHPDYKSRYDGDLRARDAAYHQGTVWSWLVGPFVDAWTKENEGREAEALRFLAGFRGHVAEACVGSISEIFDAEPPFLPRGCVAQAWGVAEVLRCLAKLGQGRAT